ncbi:type I restriction enzyme, S subunit [Pseudomonas sp. NFACC19-2]|nr:restriction endonuclease subunit S [Pseudomonas sp. NFACC19-2]SFW38289.1 type I restriction enzyme, S subunit [Pseudomonas sp. NFACC19-2]
MTALLTDNLPLLAGAPNGIKKLRELILELAVRGKLVPQDPNDEPASELLKRIAEEKARLVAEGKLKKQKSLPEVDEEETPYVLPSNWKWVRFDSASNTRLGKMLDKAKNKGDLRPYLRNTNVQWFNFEISDLKSMRFEEHELDEYRVIPGDLVICEGGEPGRCAVWQGDVESIFIQKALHRARPWLGISPFFLQFCLKAAAHSGFLDQFFTGATIKHFSGEKLAKYPVPLPPLAEQHRIVAKVDELMALCDRLEAQQTDAESAQTQLVQALLDSLTQASDATDFATNWQRLAEHFHTLFTTEPSIDALKQTLLQLAVMGKLVPQDPSDESASELLKRIAEEKARLVSEGNYKKQKPIAKLSEQEQPFVIPAGWSWTRLGDLSILITSGSRGWNEFYSDTGSSFIRSQDIKTDKLKFDNRAFVCLPETAEGLRTKVEQSDLLITITGANVAKAALVEDALDDAYVSQHVALVRLASRSFGIFIHKWLINSHGGRALLLENSYGAKPGLNLNNVRELPVPLPPIGEQHRIVAKVDQLMALCDQLKTRLTEARQLNEQLASTLVERALADDHQQGPAAPDHKVARTLLAAEITHRLHSQRTFGQRKLQKVVYLTEHAARLDAIQGDYLRDAAGPHDRQLMNQVESELRNRQWYECIDRETVGHAYRPLSQAGQHRADYQGVWSATERATIEQVIELMRGWDTDRCEMTVTLYAAWNDLILEGRTVSDEAILAEVLHNWNDTKLRFSKAKWLEVLAGMRQHELLTPSGFGRRTTGGMRTLPGFE